jgi:hypothetical protein
MTLNEAFLSDLLETNRDVLDTVLTTALLRSPTQISLSMAELTARRSPNGETAAKIILNALEAAERVETFVRMLSVLHADVLPKMPIQDMLDGTFLEEFGGFTIGNVTDDDFDFEALADFAMAAKAFRCRIKVNDTVLGSGAFVSDRLVLTAAHVIEFDAPGADPNIVPKYEVVTSDGKTYPARLTWSMPCHESEKQGQLPPMTSATTHCDAALLRIDRPLGRNFGSIDLDRERPPWQGAGRFVLIHYPQGVSIGKIRRNGDEDIRQFHNVNTDGGSSGGPGFDRSFRFLGLHQGKWQAFRRIVPFELFAANQDFRAELGRDDLPPFLWSLDGSLDGHFIIGRQEFFTAISAIIDRSAPALRGIWLKRQRTSQMDGLGFSYKMLRAYLKTCKTGFDAHQVASAFETRDLIDAMGRQILGVEAEVAHAGVGSDETTRIAHDEDRARRLVDALEEKAISDGAPLWLYFENPPSGLLDKIRYQLEHIVDEALTRPNLRIVLAGFETYDLVQNQFENIDIARRETERGLIVEYLGTVTRTDLDETVQEMNRVLNLGWDGAMRTAMIARALRDAGKEDRPIFRPEDLGPISEALRAEARKDFRGS